VEPVVVEVMSIEVVSIEPMMAVEPVVPVETGMTAEPWVRSAEGAPTSGGVPTAEPTTGVSAAAVRVRRRAAQEHQRSDQRGQPN
jgi:hypothetical protein